MTVRSYKDPQWDALEATIGAKYGVPPELLAAIRTRGERSNSDQVSSAGARSVYQIIPETRASIIKKHGIDPYLSDANAVEGAALLLRESLDRNNGDPIQAAGEYHGGPDRSRWGPINAAYRKRVAQGLQQYAALDTTATDAPQEPTITDLMDAYRSGKMDPGARSDFEADVRNGLLAIPARFQDEILGPKPEQATPDLLEAYQSGKMSPDARADFEADVNAGLLILPQTQPTNDYASNFVDPEIAAARQAAQPERMGAPGGPALPPADQIPLGTNPLPEQFNDFRSMPELNQLSMAGAKAGIGSALAGSPAEVAQILQANYPNIQIKETPEGIVATSGMDGVPYLIPNKASMRDLPSAAIKMAPYAALGPAGAATSVWGGAGINLAQQKAREWAGGRPTDYSEVLTSGLVAGAAPVVAPLAAAGVGAIANRMRPATNAADDAAAAARPPQASEPVPAQAQTMGAQPIPEPAPQPAPRAVAANVERFAPLPDEVMGRRATPAATGEPPIAQVSAEPPPVNYDDLAQLMRAASEGDSAAAVRLGELMQQQDPAIVDAAKRLGFGEDDLPLDWFLANRSAQEIVRLAKSQSGSLLGQQHYDAVGRVGQRAQTMLEELGGTRDLSAMDAGVKAEMQATQAELKARTGALYNDLRNMVTPSARVQAENLIAWITRRKEDLGGMLEGMEAKIAARLEMGNPTYGYLDSLRAEIGEAVGSGMKRNAYSDLETGIAKQLYKAASADIDAAATAAGAGDLLQVAKQSARAQKDIEKAIVNLFGKDISGSLLTGLETGVKNLAKGDITRLSKTLQNVPADMRQDVMATALNAAFNRSFRRGEMSFSAFADWYDRLATNKQAMAIVMSNLPKGAPAQLKALADLSRGIVRASPLAKTGYINQMTLRDALAKSDTLIHNLVGLAKRTSVGLIAEPVAASIGLPGSGLTAALVASLVKGRPNTLIELDQLLSTPEFRRLVKAIGTPEEKIAIKALAKHGIMARFFGSVMGKKGTIAEREQWLEQSMTNKTSPK